MSYANDLPIISYIDDHCTQDSTSFCNGISLRHVWNEYGTCDHAEGMQSDHKAHLGMILVSIVSHSHGNNLEQIHNIPNAEIINLNRRIIIYAYKNEKLTPNYSKTILPLTPSNIVGHPHAKILKSIDKTICRNFWNQKLFNCN